MSKISIEGNASGTGTLTIAAPSTNTNRTLTLPDATGTLALTSAALTGTTDSGTPFETSLGTDAGAVNTGVNNTFIGFEAGNDNSTGTNNTAVGYGALDACTLGSNIVAVGANAFGAFNRAGDSSSAGVAIGANAGSSVTTGFHAVIVGNDAGKNLTTGVFNVYVGYDTTASAGGVGDEIVIGTRTTTGKGGNTGFINPNTGGVYQGNNSGSWSTTSDQRLKKNIVDNTEGLEKINALRVRNFEYRLPEEVDAELKPSDAVGRTGVQLGVIAQELQQVCPDCVTEQTTGVLSVDTDEIFWHMVNAIKELKAELDQAKTRIAALENNNA
jgi:hypothetical protein